MFRKLTLKLQVEADCARVIKLKAYKADSAQKDRRETGDIREGGAVRIKDFGDDSMYQWIKGAIRKVEAWR